MQAAPRLVGQVPCNSAYPRKQRFQPSHQPLPRSSGARAASGSICSFVITAAFIIAPLALGYVSVRVLVTENSYRIQNIRTEIDNQKELSEKIRLQNAKLASLERVKKVATEKLAMTEPTVEAKIISLPGNGVTSPEYAFLAEKEVR